MSGACFWLALILGASAIWYGTYRKRNRRRRGVLPPPSDGAMRRERVLP